MAIDASTGKLLGACINVAAVKNEVEETLEDSLQKYKVKRNYNNTGFSLSSRGCLTRPQTPVTNENRCRDISVIEPY
jgi:hypothetical protein